MFWLRFIEYINIAFSKGNFFSMEYNLHGILKTFSIIFKLFSQNLYLLVYWRIDYFDWKELSFVRLWHFDVFSAYTVKNNWISFQNEVFLLFQRKLQRWSLNIFLKIQHVSEEKWERHILSKIGLFPFLIILEFFFYTSDFFCIERSKNNLHPCQEIGFKSLKMNCKKSFFSQIIR